MSLPRLGIPSTLGVDLACLNRPTILRIPISILNFSFVIRLRTFQRNRMSLGVLHIHTQEQAQAELERQRRMARARNSRRKELAAADLETFRIRKRKGV